jgi:hypothetical protein
MKTYSKPIVSQIQLVMDQAVLTACKTVGAHVGNPYTPAVDCDYGMPGSQGDCFDAGS